MYWVWVVGLLFGWAFFSIFFFHLAPIDEVLYHELAQLFFETVNCYHLPCPLLSTFTDQPCMCEESPAFV